MCATGSHRGIARAATGRVLARRTSPTSRGQPLAYSLSVRHHRHAQGQCVPERWSDARDRAIRAPSTCRFTPLRSDRHRCRTPGVRSLRMNAIAGLARRPPLCHEPTRVRQLCGPAGRGRMIAACPRAHHFPVAVAVAVAVGVVAVYVAATYRALFAPSIARTMLAPDVLTGMLCAE